MATFVDLPFESLMENAPKVIREGLSGTRTYVFPLPDKPDHGLIVELNEHGKSLGSWIITKGNAYRITPQKVTRMPRIENDSDFVRRFCRMNGIALTKIKRVARQEVVHYEHAHHQGDDGDRWITESDPAVKIVSCNVTTNPSVEWNILVVKGEEPKTWEAFCEIAKEWYQVQDGYYKLS